MIDLLTPAIGYGVLLELDGLGDAYIEREGDPIRSDLPALITTGEIDPRTPPSNARRLAKGLSRAHVVIAPGYGHERPPDCIFASSSRVAPSLDVRGVGGLLADSIGWSMVMALLLCFAAVLLREVFRGIWLATGTLV